MRPGGIEVHVNWKRTGPPDRYGCDEGPQRLDIFASETEGKEQAKKSVQTSAEGHGVAIGIGEAIRRYMGSQCPREQNSSMGGKKEGRPEHGRAHGKVIVKVARAGTKFFPGLGILVAARFAKTIVRLLIVAGKIEIVLDKRGSSICVVTDAISSDPWVKQRDSSQKDNQQNPFESVLLGLEVGIQVRFQSAPHRIADP